MKLNRKKIFAIMADQGLTQKKLSELSGYSCNAVRNAIRGNVNCKPITAGAIAKALGVDVTEILVEES